MVTINRAKDILNFWFGTGATPSKKKIQSWIAVNMQFLGFKNVFAMDLSRLYFFFTRCSTRSKPEIENIFCPVYCNH